MPRRNRPRQPKRNQPADPQAGRSHSHRSPTPPESGYEGVRLRRLAGRLAVLQVEGGVSDPVILDRRPLPSTPKQAPVTATTPAPATTPTAFVDVCPRHPQGRSTFEPCTRCARIDRRAARRAEEEGVCPLHPSGDTGQTCSGCAVIRRQQLAAGVAVPRFGGGPSHG